MDVTACLLVLVGLIFLSHSSFHGAVFYASSETLTKNDTAIAFVFFKCTLADKEHYNSCNSIQ
jgi:hypothetical protein